MQLGKLRLGLRRLVQGHSGVRAEVDHPHSFWGGRVPRPVPMVGGSCGYWPGSGALGDRGAVRVSHEASFSVSCLHIRRVPDDRPAGHCPERQP